MSHKIRWTSQKIAQRLNLIQPLVYRQRHPLPPFRYLALSNPKEEPPIGVTVDDNNWAIIEPNSYWGHWMTNFVLRTTFTPPTDWPTDAPIALHLPLGIAGDFSHPEALAYIDGTPIAGCDRHHQEILLPATYQNGRLHHLALHGWTGLQGWLDNEPKTKLFMRACALVQIDQPTRDFIATARVALGIAEQLDDNDPAKALLYNALNDAFLIVDTREPFADPFYTSIPIAHDALKTAISQVGPPQNIHILAAGHAHIDIAWLWTVAQARLKAGRTFHTVLRLMEQFPDYHFTQSQPQLYEYIRQDYPDLFSAIQERIHEKRWEPIGGMWVEADCNLSGAEALARQFLLGRTFFRQQFGPDAETPVLWLPDVFGYAWNLPQLIQQAGLKYFFTIKISWNQYNRIPYDTFWWQGLDGTRILTHFSTTLDTWSASLNRDNRPVTYNATASPLEVKATWANLQQKEHQQNLLMAFGYGDGGGGPTREMLENIREMNHFPATPQIKNGRVADFFRQLDDLATKRPLPIWNGELYLEYHRGTYTSQARNKRGNRKSEFLLHDAEFLAAWAAAATDYDYPHTQLTHAWQRLCLNQFHDILPGSSITPVYNDSLQDYETIRTIGQSIRDAAITKLAHLLPIATKFVALNPTSFAGPQIGLLPQPLTSDQTIINLINGNMLTTQQVERGTLIELPHIEAYGLIALGSINIPPRRNVDEETVAAYSQNGSVTLTNACLRAEFDEAGNLIDLYDKVGQRHVFISTELANAFQAFEDRPLNWDAWDIDIFYDDKQWSAEPAHQITIRETGPLRAGVEIRRRLLNSEIVQHIYLYKNGRCLHFDTTVDWREQHILLKVAFPVNILSPTATYDVQWGNVQRPTHRNTSWDWARFETCAHKWVDLSEGDYGVSLLNDCKYGHDIQDNIIRLTLLRSPTYPDPEADQGEHHFTYALLPHIGDWRTGTVPAAYALNDPLIIQPAIGGGGQLQAPFLPPSSNNQLPPSLVWTDAPNVIIETVKQAEDGNGIIIRLYENERRRGIVTIHTGFRLAAVYECNLLEDIYGQLTDRPNSVRFPLKPYQIVTLRLIPTSSFVDIEE